MVDEQREVLKRKFENKEQFLDKITSEILGPTDPADSEAGWRSKVLFELSYRVSVF